MVLTPASIAALLLAWAPPPQQAVATAGHVFRAIAGAGATL
jgi:hypothetical protein